jgi:hypothetical protein
MLFGFPISMGVPNECYSRKLDMRSKLDIYTFLFYNVIFKNFV